MGGLQDKQAQMEACRHASNYFAIKSQTQAFVDGLTSAEANALGHTTDGFSVATLLTNVLDYGWSSWIHRIPYEQTPMYQTEPAVLRWHALVRKGIDVNAPDAQGRVPSLQAFSNDTRNLNVEDISWAFKMGTDPLLVECHDGQYRSILSISFLDNSGCEEILLALQGAIKAKVETLPTPLRAARLEAFFQAPVRPEHGDFKSQLMGPHLHLAWPQSPSCPPSQFRF